MGKIMECTDCKHFVRAKVFIRDGEVTKEIPPDEAGWCSKGSIICNWLMADGIIRPWCRQYKRR